MKNKHLKILAKAELENMENFKKEIALNLSLNLYSLVDKKTMLNALEILIKNIEVLKSSVKDEEKISKIISGLPVLYITIKSIPVLNKVS